MLKASQESRSAAESQAQASRALLYPRLTFDGTYFYQTQIPQLNIGSLLGNPNFPPLSFGANSNYSIGPSLYHTLFDAGQISTDNAKSFETVAKARDADFKAYGYQLQLTVRMAYFRVQLNLKDLILTVDSLKLSETQDRDIQNRFKAGAASRLDAVNSRREVLNYQLKNAPGSK